MKFTALEEYGLRCMLYLARRADPSLDAVVPNSRGAGEESGNGHQRSPGFGPSVTLGEVAEREGLTQQYAGKIFRILARGGLVESERGRKGGYRLTRRSEEITVSEVLTAVGGRFFDREVCGRYTGDRDSCVHSTNCAIRRVWSDVQRAVDQVLTGLTLRDLVLEKIRAERGVMVPEVFSLQGTARQRGGEGARALRQIESTNSEDGGLAPSRVST